jgi:hypothetical protein
MIEGLMESLGGDNLGAIMGMLGDGDSAPSEDVAKSAIGTGLGAILGGLAKNAAEPEGAESLFNAVTEKHDGGILDDIGGFLGVGDAVDGGKILGHVFGDKQPEVESQVAQAAGIDASLISKLLPMLAPMVLGWIGKKVASGGLNANSLGGMLQGEKQSAESSMPDLGDLLGGILGGGGSGGVGAMLSSGMDALSGGGTAAKKSGGGILDMLKGLFSGKR